MYTNKTVLITGASRGVGKMLADYFLENGATVIGLSKGQGNIHHSNYAHYAVDLGKPDEIVQVFRALGKEKKSIDILINNAAVLTSQYAMIMPISNVEAMVNVNFLGAFVVAREASKLMRKNEYSRIVNISSMAVVLEPMGDSIYAATKAAITSVSNVLAKEFAGMNITCNTVGITAIETDMLNSHTDSAKAKIKEIIANLPVPRMAAFEDIANVVDFFCSPNSGYITAQTIYLGGLHA
jgi:3-oxoacyl-[acyl-carrier protein] reductase